MKTYPITNEVKFTLVDTITDPSIVAAILAERERCAKFVENAMKKYAKYSSSWMLLSTVRLAIRGE